jgi:hypothetical protein
VPSSKIWVGLNDDCAFVSGISTLKHVDSSALHTIMMR